MVPNKTDLFFPLRNPKVEENRIYHLQLPKWINASPEIKGLEVTILQICAKNHIPRIKRNLDFTVPPKPIGHNKNVMGFLVWSMTS